MPVAKTYQSLEQQGEPFVENKRTYVNVITTKGIKKVRWYSDTEYRRMYPEEEKHDIMDFNARHAFGFGELGYITIYRGNQSDLKKFVEEHHESFRRNLTFGYYTPSYVPVCILPDNIIPVQLKWEEVQDHDDRMKPHEEVAKYVANILGQSNNSSTSIYQGKENDWLEKTVTIKENISREDHFGEKHTHYMHDSEGNTYIWETGAKNFEVGMVIKLRMKVKSHKEINGEKCTVVWYCKEI